MDVQRPNLDGVRRLRNCGMRLALGSVSILGVFGVANQVNSPSPALGANTFLDRTQPEDKLSGRESLSTRGEGVPLVALAGLKYRTCLSTGAPLFRTKAATCNLAIEDTGFRKRGKVLVIPWSKSPNLVQTTKQWNPNANFVKGCFEDSVDYEAEAGKSTVFVVVGSAACTHYTRKNAPRYIRDLLDKGPRPQLRVMQNNGVTILGIESSCDETAAAVIVDGRTMLSNTIASSVDLHTLYGGVVPEIAARSHIELIIPVIEETMSTAKTQWKDIDAIAITRGPGLGGSLLIGVMTARTLSITKNKPLYGINHVMAHPFATFITTTKLENYTLPEQQPDYPLLSLIVSGGHTQLVLFRSAIDYDLLGQTTDDAVGDKEYILVKEEDILAIVK